MGSAARKQCKNYQNIHIIQTGKSREGDLSKKNLSYLFKISWFERLLLFLRKYLTNCTVHCDVCDKKRNVGKKQYS